MSNDSTSIHEFDFALICEYFSYLDRQGPGSEAVTIKALSFIDNLTPQSVIVDLGCGTGGQTLTLGMNTLGQITGLDLYPEFIEIFNRNSSRLNLLPRVKGVVGSMDNLPFEKESIDLIWSEGAIYNIGFERGLREWSQYLRQSGYVAVTEVSWLTNDRPKEIEDFWMEQYPEIDTIAKKVSQLADTGFLPIASFVLPESCWIDNFYAPQVEAQEKFLKKYAGNKGAEDYIAFERYERGLYYKYKEYYGYVFYIGKKR